MDRDVICYGAKETRAVIEACTVILPKEARIGFRVLITTFLGIYSVEVRERGALTVYRCLGVREEGFA